MARLKHQQSAPGPKAKKKSVDEDSWIIVKKQKVTILIPLLPAPKQQSRLQNSRESPINVPNIKPTDTQSHQVEKVHMEAQLVCERREEPVVVPQSILKFPRRSMHVPNIKPTDTQAHQVEKMHTEAHLVSEREEPTVVNVVPQSIFKFPRRSIHVPNIIPNNTQSHQVEKMHTEAHLVREREEPASLEPQLTIRSTVANVVPQSNFKFPRRSRPSKRVESLEGLPMLSFRMNGTIGLCSSSKMIAKSSVDGGGIINKRIRAINLERKLQNAGGLKNWLVSRGFGHFVNIFQSKSINKYQLANLTMEKLKEMGSHPVGPRRKLIHAIDCLCHPCITR